MAWSRRGDFNLKLLCATSVFLISCFGGETETGGCEVVQGEDRTYAGIKFMCEEMTNCFIVLDGGHHPQDILFCNGYGQSWSITTDGTGVTAGDVSIDDDGGSGFAGTYKICNMAESGTETNSATDGTADVKICSVVITSLGIGCTSGVYLALSNNNATNPGIIKFQVDKRLPIEPPSADGETTPGQNYVFSFDVQNPTKAQNSPPVSIQAFGIAITAYPMDKESATEVPPSKTCTSSGAPLLFDVGPIAVTDPAFCTKIMIIAQSSNVPCEDNTFTVTLRTNFQVEIVANRTVVTIAGQLSAYAPDGDMVLMGTANDGSSYMSTASSCTSEAGTGTWDNSADTLTLYTIATLPCSTQIELSFMVVNPPLYQTNPDVPISGLYMAEPESCGTFQRGISITAINMDIDTTDDRAQNSITVRLHTNFMLQLQHKVQHWNFSKLGALIGSNHQEQAAGAMLNLAMPPANPATKTRIVEDGGLMPLVALLRSADKSIQKLTAGAIRNLATDHDTINDNVKMKTAATDFTVGGDWSNLEYMLKVHSGASGASHSPILRAQERWSLQVGWEFASHSGLNNCHAWVHSPEFLLLGVITAAVLACLVATSSDLLVKRSEPVLNFPSTPRLLADQPRPAVWLRGVVGFVTCLSSSSFPSRCSFPSAPTGLWKQPEPRRTKTFIRPSGSLNSALFFCSVFLLAFCCTSVDAIDFLPEEGEILLGGDHFLNRVVRFGDDKILGLYRGKCPSGVGSIPHCCADATDCSKTQWDYYNNVGVCTIYSTSGLVLTAPFVCSASMDEIPDGVDYTQRGIAEPRGVGIDNNLFAISYLNSAGGPSGPEQTLYLRVWRYQSNGGLPTLEWEQTVRPANPPFTVTYTDVTVTRTGGTIVVVWITGQGRLYVKAFSGAGALLADTWSFGSGSSPPTVTAVGTDRFVVSWPHYGNNIIVFSISGGAFTEIVASFKPLADYGTNNPLTTQILGVGRVSGFGQDKFMFACNWYGNAYERAPGGIFLTVYSAVDGSLLTPSAVRVSTFDSTSTNAEVQWLQGDYFAVAWVRQSLVYANVFHFDRGSSAVSAVQTEFRAFTSVGGGNSLHPSISVVGGDLDQMIMMVITASDRFKIFSDVLVPGSCPEGLGTNLNFQLGECEACPKMWTSPAGSIICSNVNECANSNTNNCDPNAVCVDDWNEVSMITACETCTRTEGSYTCECTPDFFDNGVGDEAGRGTSCSEIMCESGLDDCRVLVHQNGGEILLPTIELGLTFTISVMVKFDIPLYAMDQLFLFEGVGAPPLTLLKWGNANGADYLRMLHAYGAEFPIETGPGKRGPGMFENLPALDVGVWHHIACVSEIASGVHTMTVYVNGFSHTYTTKQTYSGTYSYTNNRIGGRYSTTLGRNGLTDDFKIWTRALDPSEMLTAGYAAAIPVDGLIAWWSFQQPSPSAGQTTTTDSVGTYTATFGSQVPGKVYNTKDWSKWEVMDECALESDNNCHPNALCFNTVSSFSCSCEGAGYVDDGPADDLGTGVHCGYQRTLDLEFTVKGPNPRVARLGPSRFVIVYTKHTTLEIMAAIFDNEGSVIVPEFLVSAIPWNGFAPHVDASKTGDTFVVVWGSQYVKIYCSIVDGNTGIVLNRNLLVRTTRDAVWMDVHYPQVAVKEDGSFAVVWQDSDTAHGTNDEGGSGIDSMAKIFASNGAVLVAEFRVNQFVTGTQSGGTISYLGNGRFVNVWINIVTVSYQVGYNFFDSNGAVVMAKDGLLIGDFRWSILRVQAISPHVFIVGVSSMTRIIAINSTDGSHVSDLIVMSSWSGSTVLDLAALGAGHVVATWSNQGGSPGHHGGTYARVYALYEGALAPATGMFAVGVFSHDQSTGKVAPLGDLSTGVKFVTVFNEAYPSGANNRIYGNIFSGKFAVTLQPTTCESDLCYRDLGKDVPYPATIFYDSVREQSYFFPPEFQCAIQSTSQAVAGVFSTFQVTTCGDCSDIAATTSSTSSVCFEPEEVTSTHEYAWWPHLNIETQDQTEPEKHYSMLLELQDVVLVGAVEIVFGASAGELLEIDSITVCFSNSESSDITTSLQNAWLGQYEDLDTWQLFHVKGGRSFDDVADMCVNVIEGPIELGAETAVYRTRRKSVPDTYARHILLQVISRGDNNPVIEKFDVLPPQKEINYCTESISELPVCFCPPGYLGFGEGQNGCNSTAWTVAVPVNLTWASSHDIEQRFGFPASIWAADEIHFWQVLLGEDAIDPTGASYSSWMWNMKVSVLEARPGEFVAMLYPLFEDETTASLARDRLMSYLASNDNTIMHGTAHINTISVRAWDADVQQCPRLAWGQRSSKNCTTSSFPLCLDVDGDPNCMCTEGRVGQSVWCSDVSECEMSPETCHINEICTLTCDVNECDLEKNLHDCDVHALCRNTLDSFHCECTSGWKGTGTVGNCADANECEGGTHDCHSSALCENCGVGDSDCPNGFKCNCGRGLQEAQGENQQLQCVDVNECFHPDSNNCHENATCTDIDSSFTCACHAGFESAESPGEFPGVTCFDVEECEEETHACDTHASCTNTIGSYACSCQPGWSGPGQACSDVNECYDDPGPCDPNANCSNVPGTFECTCNQGYQGSGLECADVDECSLHRHDCDTTAVCNNTAGGFTCLCGVGWEPLNDEMEQEGRLVCIDVDECTLMPRCNDNAACTNTNGSYLCSCSAGFRGDGLECLLESVCLSLKCLEQADCRKEDGEWGCQCLHPYSGNGSWCQEDECASGKNDCHVSADCTDTIGSFQCACGIGWDGDGVACEDVDECGPEGVAAGICAVEADCANTNGSFTCLCAPGYRDESGGMGLVCLDVVECDSALHTCDGELAACHNTIGSFTCTCNRGYTDDSGLGVECRDMDECREGRDSVGECGNFASCINNEGSFECACFPGFERNGTNVCENLDECADDTWNNCGANTHCTDVQGSFLCSCNVGYQDKDGLTCTDLDECSEPNAAFLCEDNAECSNTVGSFTCVCIDGFLQDQADGIVSCQELDECLFGLDDCHFGAACENSNGSFTCDCLPGWFGNGLACYDVNECSEQDDETLCPGEASCLNTVGSFFCGCPTGKRVDTELSCVDIDECLVEEDNCHDIGASCNNTEGSFRCNCREGWEGDGVSCSDINECERLVSNCLDSPTANCFNNDGSFTCECDHGYTGEDCSQRSCGPGKAFANGTKGCGDCRPGTFSPTGTVCMVCPAGTFSGRGAPTCEECPTDLFSLPGSEHCSLVKVESSCPDCTFAAIQSAGDRKLVRVGSCGSCLDLIISNARISSIDGAFAGMEQLQTLDLSWNELRRLRMHMFQDLHSLKTINLKGNRLFGRDGRGPNQNNDANIQGVFKSLSNLKEIHLHLGGQRPLAGDDQTVMEVLEKLVKSGSLKTLDLSTSLSEEQSTRRAIPRRNRGSSRRRTPARRQSELETSLLELNLAGVDIGALESGDFPFPNLQVLNLAGCGISQIDEEAFQYVPNLVELHLQNNVGKGNKILSAGVFAGMTQLQVLDLRNSRIAGIQAGALASFSRLKQLFLSDNLLCIVRPGSKNQNLCNLVGEELDIAAFRGLSKLEVLDLSDNVLLGVLHSGLFAGLQSLQSLLVRQNRVHTGLVQIDADALHDLTSLLTLDLSGNSLETLDDDLFVPLKELRDMNLRHNRLEQINAKLLVPLTKLQFLRLDHNSLLRIEDGTFDRLQKLTILDLSFNFLMDSPFLVTPLRGPDNDYTTYFPAAGFGKLVRLEELDLSHNELKFVYSTWFAGLFRLRSLSLAFNRISHLAPGSFRDLLLLEVLDLQGNHYNPAHFLTEDTRARHVYLQALALPPTEPSIMMLQQVYNEYKQFMKKFQWRTVQRFMRDWGSMVIPQRAFEGLASLQTLKLSHNGLRAIPPGCFDMLTSLTTLHLDWNLIQSFHDEDFSNLHSLHSLRLLQRGTPCNEDDDMCWSSLACLPENTTARGVIVDVNSAVMPRCPGLEYALPLLQCPGCEFSLTKGTTLSRSGTCELCLRMGLSNCGIVTIEEGTFGNVPGARQLELQGNMLQDMDGSPFSGLLLLRTLDLSQNQLTAVHKSLFDGLAQLRQLDLSNNMLIRIEAAAFAKLSSLERLFLGGHRLQHIDMESMGLPPTLIFLDLSVFDIARTFEDILSLPTANFLTKSFALHPKGSEVTWSSRVNHVESLKMQLMGLTQLSQFRGLSGSTLRELDLAGNLLVMLEDDGVLSDLKELRKLSLNNNRLKSIAGGVFRGLTQVVALSLHGNMLEELPEGVFNGLDNLVTLDLSENRFDRFIWEATWTVNARHVDISDQLRQMKCIPLFPRLLHCRTVSCLSAAAIPAQVLEDNKPSFMNFASFFSDLVSSDNAEDQLNLCGFISMADAPGACGCSFDTTEGRLFRQGNCSALCQAFDFSDSGISSIDATAFEGMDALRMLVLSDNAISSIDGVEFADNTRLMLLDLARNQIERISPNAFRSLRSLSHLILSQNALKTITDGVFAPLTALMYLALHQNSISVFEAVTLPELQTLKLSNNQISVTTLTDGLFKTIKNIKELELDFNSIASLPPNLFVGATKLQFLNLAHSEITSVEADAFAGLSNLVRLRLDGNAVAQLGDHSLRGLGSLQVLELQGSGVQEISEKAIHGAPYLQVLTLQNNAITHLVKDTFQKMQDRLLEINLSNNQISTIEANTFNNSQRFHILDLTHNRITALEPGTMPQVDEVFVFEGNRVWCVPVFSSNTLVIDWEYSRLPPWASFCLPSACKTSLAMSLANSGDQSWSLQERSVMQSMEQMMKMVRSDIATVWDDFLLHTGMYIDGGNGLRSWCSPIYREGSFIPTLAKCNRPGFYGNPCRPCPEDHYCPGMNRSTPCPGGQNSPPGTAHVAGCFQCDAGEYLFLDNLACKPCPEGRWCTEKTLRACPGGASCAGGTAMPVCRVNTWLNIEAGTCVSLGKISCDMLKADDESQAITEFGGCGRSDLDCACTEDEAHTCHVLSYCSGFAFAVAVPDSPDIVQARVSHPPNSDGLYACSCARELLGHGYGSSGCETKGWVVRIVYRATACLSEPEEDKLLEVLGGLTCRYGATQGCDHVHYTHHHGNNLGVNVLFRHTAEGKAAAEAAAAAFNNASSSVSLRRSGAIPPQVDPRLGARVYIWTAGTTAAPLPLLPAGLEVLGVHFEAGCAETGCWVLDVVFTTASSDVRLDSFNTLYLPYAIGSDALSFDYDYADNTILNTFQPSNFPCSVGGYAAAGGTATSLPVEATGCCFGTAFDTQNSMLGGDGNGQGMLGKYRTTERFAAYASTAYSDLCPGGYNAPNITTSGSAPTLKPEEKFPNSTEAQSFISEGVKFVGMPSSPGITRVAAMDAFLGQYEATIKLDEKELRTKAGLLRGTVGVEYTVDFFLGFANFKAATSSYILDSMATQTAIHVEKTNFFSVSTHGINDYTFLQYVNLRLIAVYIEDKDFSGVDESSDSTVRTDPSCAANYVQLTFTLGSKYDVNSNSGLIPLDSVRAGRGTFLTTVEDAGGLHHKCLEYTTSPANEFDSWAAISRFNATLTQECGPAAVMCSSPESIPDSFVSFNIPLGTEVFGDPSQQLDNNVFVELVISAVDNDARNGFGSQSDVTSPNAGQAPWQMKTTLSASIPVVAGGINIFCDGITAKTDLKNVANVDIVVGSAASLTELSRLRTVSDVASSQLDVQGEVVIDSDSIEAGLMTLVIKGDDSYFQDNAGINTRGVSLELEDVMTIHFMESDGAAADGSGSEGKQAAVKALLAEPADDNTDAADGLDTDGYALNGAFFFDVDRSAQRAHLQPSQRLLAICPFNPPRPQVTGSVVMETCVMRRDVRYRDYPWRVGTVSTAMEVTSNAFETRLETSSVESGFFASIFGNSIEARQLAVDFASAIDEKYSLDGRSRRAFWINPGYEWSPTQTGGASLFQLSQKIFLFALVTLDEQIASAPGKSIHDASPFSEATKNQPKVPAARRRMLLTVDPAKGDKSTLSSAQLSFAVTKLSMIASAYGVPLDLVAKFAVELELLPEQECLGREELQLQIHNFLEPYVKQSAGATTNVQVLSFSTPWTLGTGCGARRATQSRFTANVDMLVIFSEATAPVFDLAGFSVLPRINTITPVTVSDAIQVQTGSTVQPEPLSDADSDSDSNSLNIGLVAGACGGALVFCLAAGAILYRRLSSSREVLATQVMYMTNPASVHTSLQFRASESAESGCVETEGGWSRSTKSQGSKEGMLQDGGWSRSTPESQESTKGLLQDAIF